MPVGGSCSEIHEDDTPTTVCFVECFNLSQVQYSTIFAKAILGYKSSFQSMLLGIGGHPLNKEIGMTTFGLAPLQAPSLSYSASLQHQRRVPFFQI